MCHLIRQMNEGNHFVIKHPSPVSPDRIDSGKKTCLVSHIHAGFIDGLGSHVGVELLKNPFLTPGNGNSPHQQELGVSISLQKDALCRQ